MFLSSPAPFQEAINAALVKSLLPTTGRTADLRQLESAVKRRALWSATVTSTNVLKTIADGTDAILRGEVDQATVSLEIRRMLEAEGYQPAPEDRGTMLDLASELRRNTIIETQVGMARGLGWHQQGMQEDVLEEFPAQELFRATSPQGGAAAERKWAQIWTDEGGLFFNGRMIALKTDEIWERLGDPSRYPDGLGNAYPPFRINSGMRVRDIDRDETEALGLIKPGARLTPAPADDFTADLQATAAMREDWLRSAIADSGLATFGADGVLRFNDGGVL